MMLISFAFGRYMQITDLLTNDIADNASNTNEGNTIENEDTGEAATSTSIPDEISPTDIPSTAEIDNTLGCLLLYMSERVFFCQSDWRRTECLK